MSTKLKSKAELSSEQAETVVKWLAANEDKKLDFILRFHEKIELKIDNGIFKHNNESNIGNWAWAQIESWMKEMKE